MAGNEKVLKEYSIGNGSDKINPSEEVNESFHGVGDKFYDKVQNVSNDPRQVVPSPDKAKNMTR